MVNMTIVASIITFNGLRNWPSACNKPFAKIYWMHPPILLVCTKYRHSSDHKGLARHIRFHFRAHNRYRSGFYWLVFKREQRSHDINSAKQKSEMRLLDSLFSFSHAVCVDINQLFFFRLLLIHCHTDEWQRQWKCSESRKMASARVSRSLSPHKLTIDAVFIGDNFFCRVVTRPSENSYEAIINYVRIIMWWRQRQHLTGLPLFQIRCTLYVNACAATFFLFTCLFFRRFCFVRSKRKCKTKLLIVFKI